MTLVIAYEHLVLAVFNICPSGKLQRGQSNTTHHLCVSHALPSQSTVQNAGVVWKNYSSKVDNMDCSRHKCTLWKLKEYFCVHLENVWMYTCKPKRHISSFLLGVGMTPTVLASWGGPRQGWGGGRAPGAWGVGGCSTGQAQAFSAKWRCQQGFQNPAFARCVTFSTSLNQSLFCRQCLVKGLRGPGLLPSQHSPWAQHGRLLLPWPLPAPTAPLACGLPAPMPPGGLCPRLSVRKCSWHQFCLWAAL